MSFYFCHKAIAYGALQGWRGSSW